MNRKNLQMLARTRLREAKALIDLGLYDGAYYLAGYAVECALKACIAKETKRHDFPDKKRVDASYSHNLKDLARVAELVDAFRLEASRDAVFRNYWDHVQSWSEQSRYRTHAQNVAQALVDAVGNRKHGVLPWIKRFW